MLSRSCFKACTSFFSSLWLQFSSKGVFLSFIWNQSIWSFLRCPSLILILKSCLTSNLRSGFLLFRVIVLFLVRLVLVFWIAVVSFNSFHSFLKLHFEFVSFCWRVGVFVLRLCCSEFGFDSDSVLNLFRLGCCDVVHVHCFSCVCVVKCEAAFWRSWVFLHECLLIRRKINCIHWIVLRNFYSFLKLFLQTSNFVL